LQESFKYYAGVIQQISTASKSNWESITVQWEDETSTTISAWEIKEVEEETDMWKQCPQMDPSSMFTFNF
jgi:hypothetical protein